MDGPVEIMNNETITKLEEIFDIYFKEHNYNVEDAMEEFVKNLNEHLEIRYDTKFRFTLNGKE